MGGLGWGSEGGLSIVKYVEGANTSLFHTRRNYLSNTHSEVGVLGIFPLQICDRKYWDPTNFSR
jgi:hypothetical protein